MTGTTGTIAAAGDGQAAPADGTARRIVALDGLRGVLTIMVVLSHFFAELPGGLMAFALGWIAVDLFFVLSGFLVGRLILEKGRSANFAKVFYARRLLRTVPSYILCVLVALAIFSVMPPAWSEYDKAFPLWSYLTFTQNLLMAEAGEVGAHWLAPTWTLAVEEQFYLFAPAAILLTPARWRVRMLVAVALGAMGLRAWIYYAGLSPIAALALFPTRADALAAGLVAAIIWVEWRPDWARLEGLLRIGPLLILAAVAAVLAVEGQGGAFFQVGSHFAVGVAGALFILAIMRDVPEAGRLKSPVLCFFGNTSYAVYLTHLPVLWLMHGLMLGQKPALGSPAQWLVTLAALPVAFAVGWAITRVIEEPITAYGRTFRWQAPAGADAAERVPAAKAAG